MLELYKRRVQSKGAYIGDMVKNQSDKIMDATFLRDVATKRCYIDNELVYAKFQKYTTYSINKDVIDYHLQFMTGVHYPEGTYVYIPDDTGTYNTWLIVGRDDDSQFVKYSILKCNWTLWWIYEGKLLSCLGVLKSNSTSGNGLTDDGVITVVDGTSTFWLPTTSKVQTIGYNQRFLISENKINPISYYVSNMQDTLPVGITKLTLSKGRYNPKTDKLDLNVNGREVMVADYYSSTIEPTVPDSQEPSPTRGYYSKITHNGTSPTVKIGGSYRTITSTFYNEVGDVLPDIVPVWSYDFPINKESQFVIEPIVDNPNQIKIKALRDYELVGQIVTIKVADINMEFQSELKVEVVA